MGDLTKINLHIHSPGGDVFEGRRSITCCATTRPASTWYIDGLAASMASSHRHGPATPSNMPENAMMMVHKP
ncbi:ATP-dependent Clp protease proteolytic subunit [Pseudomonas aeruginosa]